ncbi:MAG TPA: methyltransferase domain-containing protein [Clostridia bacterium]|nr:methyltransferase domain-containing protein [Clostridia bacterium]
MSDYKSKVAEAYAGGREAGRAAEAGTYGLEFLYTKRALDPHITSDADVVELGCGGGYYGLYYAGRCKSYLGIDLSPVNIEAFQQQIAERGLVNVRAEIGDATELAGIPDEAFDVVLCLGPMYHLDREDRQRCMRACKRVCKPGGIIALAYINKAGAIAKFGIAYGWDKVFTQRIDEYVLTRGTDDVRMDVFFYTMPEELEEDARNAGLDVLASKGLDFLIFENTIETMGDGQRATLFHFMDLIHESPSCAGLANHALLLCRKA